MKDKSHFEEEIAVPPLGLRLMWGKKLLVRIILFWSHKEVTGKSSYASVFFSALKSYLSKQPVTWPYLPLAWEKVSPFQKKVLKFIQKNLKFGEHTTYGEVAKACNIPKGARAVGQALKANPWPLIIPCHRVLSKDGFLCGFSQGTGFKKFLLTLEGVDWKEKSSHG